MARQHDGRLPFPGDPSSESQREEVLSSTVVNDQQQHQYRSRTLSQHAPIDDFYSTTTEPLRGAEAESSDGVVRANPYSFNSTNAHDERSSFDGLARTDSPSESFPPRGRTGSTGSTSILDRGRPRANSFFGLDQEESSRPSVDFGDAASTGGSARPSGDWRRGDDAYDSQQGAVPGERFEGIGVGRPSSFFGVPASPGPESTFGDYSRPAGDPAAAEPEPDYSNQPRRASRSSFYGLEGPFPSSSSQPQNGTTDLPSFPHHPNGAGSHYSIVGNGVGNGNGHASGNGGDSGSGSFSSHELPGGASGRRYHSAPYAASRAASLYGISSGGADPVPIAPLLDHSHLQPGALASLLSHEKTLELYRTNAKKTNDPDIQFEFCTFVMEVVGEMEAAAGASLGSSNGASATGNGTGAAGAAADREISASKQKQQGLVSESVALLAKLASRGHVKSQYFLADCYTQGVGTSKGKRDFEKAFPLFVLAGKHGHADACYRAAQCCENGWGTKRKLGEAVSLYRRAAVLNHPGAMHRLGLAELNGELNLSKRPREGVKWLKRAAELADQVDPPQPQSLHELALLHERGIDNIIFKDEEYAAELLARASELSYAPSAYKLGECYEYGKMGCPQDSALSIHYYNIAAQQNHREACFALTAWYLVGSSGVLPQSDTEAYLWARKAADMGLAKAQYAVGYFTEVGIGTYKDDREALDWFRKAADQGDKRAKDRLRMVVPGGPLSAAQFRREQPLPRPPPQPSQSHAVNRPSTTPPPPPSSVYKPPPVSNTNRIQKQRKANGKAPLRPQSVDRVSSAPYRGNGGGYSDEEDNESSFVSGRPAPPPRQRSNSQPTPMDPYLASSAQSQYSYDPAADPYASFGPGSTYDRPVPPHQQRQQAGQFRPIQPGQARMPERQQLTASPILGPEKEAEMAARRERVLQKGAAARKANGGDDKDCIIS